MLKSTLFLSRNFLISLTFHIIILFLFVNFKIKENPKINNFIPVKLSFSNYMHQKEISKKEIVKHEFRSVGDSAKKKKLEKNIKESKKKSEDKIPIINDQTNISRKINKEPEIVSKQQKPIISSTKIIDKKINKDIDELKIKNNNINEDEELKKNYEYLNNKSLIKENKNFEEYKNKLRYLIQKKALENYPRRALRKGAEGIVELVFTLNVNGELKNLYTGKASAASDELIASSLKTIKMLSPFEKNDILKTRREFIIKILYKIN